MHGLTRIEGFDHHDPDTGRDRCYVVTAFLQYASHTNREVNNLHISNEIFFAAERNGIETDRLNQAVYMMRRHGGWYGGPVVVAESEDRKHILCDGNHRVMASVYCGYRDVPAVLLTYEEQHLFSFDYTGISENEYKMGIVNVFRTLYKELNVPLPS